MKSVLASLVFLSFAAASARAATLAGQPVACVSADKTLSVHFDLDAPTTAEVRRQGQPAAHGALTCQLRRGAEQSYLDCRTPHVADAGFHAQIYREGRSLVVSVGEYGIGGERHLALLTCDR